MKRGFALVTALAGLHAAATAVIAVNSHAAQSAAPQTVTVRDSTGDAFGHGKRQPGRRYVDIRSVTVTRPDKNKLRVVVETLARLRVVTFVTFRYVDPSGLEEAATIHAITGRGTPIIRVGSVGRRGRDSRPCLRRRPRFDASFYRRLLAASRQPLCKFPGPLRPDSMLFRPGPLPPAG